MQTQKPQHKENTRQAILRMSDAVEDAPYALNAKVVDTRLTASCSIQVAASCGGGVSPEPLVRATASCGK